MNSSKWYDKLDKIHPFPAKYPLKLASDYISRYCPSGGVVYDPFVGSGTTLLSSSMCGNVSIGSDINPIAVLISNFKITDYSSNCLDELDDFADIFCHEEIECNDLENVVSYQSIEHWFTKDAI